MTHAGYVGTSTVFRNGPSGCLLNVPVPEDLFNCHLNLGYAEVGDQIYSCSANEQSIFYTMDDIEESNFQLFRDCLSTPLIEKSSSTPTKKARKARNGRKNAIKPVMQTEEPNDAEELGEFIDVSKLSIPNALTRIQNIH